MRVGLLAVLGLTLVATPAQAEQWDDTLDVSLRFTGGWADIDGLPLHATPYDQAPAIVDAADLGLSARGPLLSGTMRGDFSLSGFRFGGGFGYAGFADRDGIVLRHLPLADGATLQADGLVAMPLEVFAGYVLPFWDDARPYVEARGGLTILQMRVEAIHPELGTLGTTAFNGYAPSVGLSLGVIVPINSYLFFDGGASLDLIGPARLSMHVSIGLPIPLSHL